MLTGSSTREAGQGRGGGRGRPIRVALVGVGNCASALVQGVHFYSSTRGGPSGGSGEGGGAQPAAADAAIPGLMHANLGGYTIADIRFAAAFDISAAKVGRDLSEAIFAEPNNTCRFVPPDCPTSPSGQNSLPPSGCRVHRGPTLDGFGRCPPPGLQESDDHPADVARILRQSETEIVVSFLPVGAEKATAHYAEQALEAGCAFINCIPVFIASDPAWRSRFAQRGLPLIGDDVKSQFGATIVHRALARLLEERGLRLDRTYQLNIGGNSDFLNMTDRERLHAKKTSKMQAISSQLDHPLSGNDIHVGPSDYVPWLADRKVCYIRCEATTFGNVPLSFEAKLEVWDSPNSAGVVVDAIRCARLALDRGIDRDGAALAGPCAYFMKSPPQQLDDHEARRQVEAFIRGQQEDPRRD